jgi:hypothetical protein
MELQGRVGPASEELSTTPAGPSSAAVAAPPDVTAVASPDVVPGVPVTVLVPPGALRRGWEALRAAAGGVAGGQVVVSGTTAASRAVAGSRAGRHAILLGCYVAAGVMLTWPRVTYLAGSLPAIRDTGGYVWGFWWIAHQVVHLGNPWVTPDLAAPVGTGLAFHTLMPLPGLLMTPVTLVSGPSASYNLLTIACPGLLCYLTYRAARLWLPSGFDAVAAGAFFGLSSSLTWRSWYELNLALGALFLPLALEAAVRLGRGGGRRAAVILGLVLGAALLTDQESAVLATIVAGLALLPWLARQQSVTALGQAGLAAVTALAAGSPQLVVMVKQLMAGAASAPPHILARNYDGSGASLVQLVTPSPRLASYGLDSLATPYYAGRPSMVMVGYGAVLSAVALLGLAAAWRRPAARLLALLWVACSLLALGSRPWLLSHGYVPFGRAWHGVLMSQVMPYTWFVRLPGLANFREADRFTELGLFAAALLAGAGVAWLRGRSRPVLVVVLALGVLEAGWSGNPAGHWPVSTMATALPALDGPIAADHSRSVVVDVPFGLRGGLPVIGAAFDPETQVLATADGHPLADAWISRIPHDTLTGIQRQPFYQALLNAQGSQQISSPALLHAAWYSARAMHIGWVVVWTSTPTITRMLRLTGFRFAYRADGASVYRPATQIHLVAPLGQRARTPGKRAPGERIPGDRRVIRRRKPAPLPLAAFPQPGALSPQPGALTGSPPLLRRGGLAEAVEQAFCGETAHQAAQARREAGALLRGERGQDAGLPGLPGTPDLARDGAARRCQVEPDVALVLLVPAAPQPALALQARRQPADRALLQPQQHRQLPLRDPARRHQLDQGAGLGRRYRQPHRWLAGILHVGVSASVLSAGVPGAVLPGVSVPGASVSGARPAGTGMTGALRPGRSRGAPGAPHGGGAHGAQQLRQQPLQVGVGERRIHMDSCTAQLPRWYGRCVTVAPYNSGSCSGDAAHTIGSRL